MCNCNNTSLVGYFYILASSFHQLAAHTVYNIPHIYPHKIFLLLYSLGTIMTLPTFSLEAQLAVDTVRTAKYIDVFDNTSNI